MSSNVAEQIRSSRTTGLPWAREMTGLLAEQRERGVMWFELAWRRATAACMSAPPRELPVKPLDPEWQPFPVFYKQACEREWNGEVTHDYAGLRDLAALAA